MTSFSSTPITKKINDRYYLALTQSWNSGEGTFITISVMDNKADKEGHYLLEEFRDRGRWVSGDINDSQIAKLYKKKFDRIFKIESKRPKYRSGK